MNRTVRMEDIAAKAGVSTAAVSKALSGKEGVSTELRMKIKSIADEIGYVYKHIESRNETKTIGVISHVQYMNGDMNFYWRMYQILVRMLSEKGIYCIFEQLNDNMIQINQVPGIIRNHKVDGVIIMGQTDTDYLAYIWDNSILPIMLLDFYDGRKEYDTVISDGYMGMCRIVNYLISKGHKKIAFSGQPFSTTSITDRYFGYCKAMAENNLPMKNEWTIPDREVHSYKAKEFMLPKELPTAICCNNDILAEEMIQKLNEQGYRVPQDIAVTGFDNFTRTSKENKFLTTCEVDMERMCELCIKTLMYKIEDKDYVHGMQVVPCNLIIRGSTEVSIN